MIEVFLLWIIVMAILNAIAMRRHEAIYVQVLESIAERGLLVSSWKPSWTKYNRVKWLVPLIEEFLVVYKSRLEAIEIVKLNDAISIQARVRKINILMVLVLLFLMVVLERA